MIRKTASVMIVLAMILSLFSVSFAATDSTANQITPASFKDVKGHWAAEAISKWAGYGVISGFGGYFRPDSSITRGEMACILNNLMGYQTAAKNQFKDLKTGQFYTDAILKVNAAGIMAGDNNKLVHPTDYITKEEAAVAMARAFAVGDGSVSGTKFADASKISTWAKAAVFGLESKGYIEGDKGLFNPRAKISKAEIVTIIDNIVKGYYIKAGTYTDNVAGTAIIKVPDVVLKGISISENLIIAEGVGKGNATLDSVTVKGNTVVRGGGENSIHINGTSNLTNISIQTIGDKIRIVVSDGSNVKEIEVAKGEEIIITGKVGDVEVAASDATVYFTDANVSSAAITGSNTAIIVGKASKIGPVTVQDTADNTVLQTEAGAVVGSVTAAAKISVSGGGTVQKVVLNAGADNSKITTPNTQIAVAQNVSGITAAGGVNVTAGSNVTNNSAGTGVVTGTVPSGGSSSGTPTPTPAPAVNVTDANIVSETAITFKSDAVPTLVTWNGSNVISSITGTNPYTVTVPKINQIDNTLVVGASGYNSKTVTVSVTASIGKMKLIHNSTELEAAIADQADGQTWLLKSGNYPLDPHNGISVGSYGSGWYLPITADDLVVAGEKDAVLYGNVSTPNGTWASQNLITVFGDNVTLKGLTLMPKVEINKTVEVVGDVKFTAVDCVFAPNTIIAGADLTDGGCLYFNGYGQTRSKAIIVNNNRFDYAPIVFDGVSGSAIDITNNVWDHIGSYYAIGNTYWGDPGNITNQCADVRVKGNEFRNVDSTTKIIAARLNQTFILDAANKVNGAAINKNDFGKYINFNNMKNWLSCKDNKVIVADVAYESPYKDVDYYVSDISQLQAAINGAAADDIIFLAEGNHTAANTITVDKAVTIRGEAGFATKISTTGGNPVFSLSGAATLDSLWISKEDKVDQSLIRITGNDTTVKNSKFTGKFTIGDNEVVRAILPNAGNNFNITGNYFESVRQPAYLEGTGTVSNNFVKNTKGWVVCVNYAAAFTGNSFEGNAVDIAIIANNQTGSDNYTDVAAISEANHGAFVENQLTGKSAVNGKEVIGNVTALLSAIGGAQNGDILELAPTTFTIANTLHTNKPLTIKGSGVGKTILNVSGVPDKAWGVLINKSNTTLSDLTIVSNKTAEYNNNLKVSDEGNTPIGHLDGIVIRNVSILGGKGLDIHNATVTVDGVVVENSKGASIAVSDNSFVTITNTTTTNGAWGSVGVMENGEKSEVTSGSGNQFNEGVLYSEKFVDKGDQIKGLGSDWISYLNEADQFIYVKQLPQGAYITNGPVRLGYQTLPDALKDAKAGDTVEVTAGTYELASQLKVEKPVTISGAGLVIIKPAATFNEGTYSADKHLISIIGVEGTVKLQNLTVTQSRRSGINVWESTDVRLQDIISMENAGAGLVVTNSKAVADNFNTNGNRWGYGINVDNGSSPSAGAPATSFTLNSGTIAEEVQILTDKGGVDIVAPGYSVADYNKVSGAAVTSWYGSENQYLDTSVNFNFDNIKVSDIASVKFSLYQDSTLLGTAESSGSNLVTLLKDCAGYWEETSDTYTDVTGTRTMSCAFMNRTVNDDNGYWVRSVCTATNANVPNRLVVEVVINSVKYISIYYRV